MFQFIFSNSLVSLVLHRRHLHVTSSLALWPDTCLENIRNWIIHHFKPFHVATDEVQKTKWESKVYERYESCWILISVYSVQSHTVFCILTAGTF